MHIAITDGIITSVSDSNRARIVIDGAELLLHPESVVMPGFVDTHCHLMGLGQMAERVQLGGVNTIADCISRVALRALSTAPGEWILGFGWNETEWLDRAQPHRIALDAATPDHPVALYRVDTHSVWVNSRALAVTGIEPHDIDGGEIVVDADGRPTGLLIDNAVRLIDSSLPKPTSDRMRRWIGSAVDRCLAFGITEVHDMNVGIDALDAALMASIGGELRIRSSVFLEGMNGGWKEFGAPRSLAPGLDVVG
ncbi:MAG: amidohydrolase family protein, partial [bacterium]|nr:amidohydrolase family protein [Candidatus Kapabacteria bacterium]